MRLVRSFYEKANTKDILGLFALYTEHYSKLGAVAKVIQQPQSAGRSLSSLLTPKRLPQTPATADGTQSSMGAGILADIASMLWAWTLHSLFRIINELTNGAKLIKKFIYHETKMMRIKTPYGLNNREDRREVEIISSNLSEAFEQYANCPCSEA